MSNYSDEERERILASAQRNIAEAREITRDLPARLMALPHGETRGQRDRRELAERDEQWAREKAERSLTEYEAARLRIDIEAKIADVRAAIDSNITAEHEFLMEILAEMLATIKRDITAEIDEKIGLLKAEFHTLRAVDKADNVTELPSFLQRRA